MRRVRLGWNGLWVGRAYVNSTFIAIIVVIAIAGVASSKLLVLLVLLMIPLALLASYASVRVDEEAGLVKCPRCEGVGKVVVPKGFPDTGPSRGGGRNKEQWLNAMQEDIGIIRGHVTSETPSAMDFALARKEARRLESDIRRFADEVYGISREEIDKQGPL